MPSVFITCAVTGGGDTVSKSPHVPVTPEQIAGLYGVEGLDLVKDARRSDDAEDTADADASSHLRPVAVAS